MATLQLRRILHNRWFSAIAVCTLALAIGVNTAIFSVVYALLLHPLPYPRPNELVALVKSSITFSRSKVPVSAPEVLDLRSMASSFSSQAAIDSLGTFTLTGSGSPELVSLMHVTASVFPMLGVKPLLGGFFPDVNEQAGRQYLAVISDRLWKQRYGSDPAIVGKNIEINQQSYRVTGVIAPILEYRLAADVWVPLTFSAAELTPARRGFQNIDVIGRLKPGVTIQQAEAELQGIAANLRRQYPDVYRQSGFSLDAMPLTERAAGDLRAPLSVLMGAVLMLMLIACVNVSTLLLARGVARRKEMSIRAALGAARSRLIRQLLGESLLLVGIAGALGVLLAFAGLDLYAQFGPADLMHGTRPELNGWVIAFSVILSGAASLVFGLVPALETSRAGLMTSMNATSSGATRGNSWIRQSLVAVEVALSLILLIGAGLLVRSFARMENSSPGFRSSNVLTAELFLPAAEYRSAQQVTEFRESLLDSVRALPGVIAAGADNDPMPFSGHFAAGDVAVPGTIAEPDRPTPVVFQSRVTPAYFEAMGIPLVEGRYFSQGDNRDAVRVAVIDETLAKGFYPQEDPVGRHILTRDRLECTIVGVVGATKYRDLGAPPEPVIYLSALQSPSLAISLAIRTAGDPIGTLATVRARAAAIDPNIPFAHAATMDQRLANSITRQRYSVELMLAFAVMSALLAAIGIYGVLAFVVNQRQRELGIRNALGAPASHLHALMMLQGSAPVGAGVVLGILGAVALTRVLRSLLFEVSPLDPATFGVVPVALLAVALIAIWIPAARAARVDPITALRAE